jgi:N-acetylglucosamine-6-phosphate deacetylase
MPRPTTSSPAHRRPATGQHFGCEWFDFQVNGFGGVDFQSDNLSLDDLRRAVTALRHHGVARIFATLITDGVEQLCRRLQRLEELRDRDPTLAPFIAGYHLEGPWLCPTPGYCGAHPRGAMHAPSKSEFERLQNAAGGHIRLITLAPEWPGSPEFIAALTETGVHVALGHTNASDLDIDAAISAGARFCTHLGNAVPMTLPRHDNVVQRLLARDELTACFIPDGVHLPPFVLRNFYRAKPPGRVLFTTDAMAGAGAPPGTYTLGALAVEVGPDCIARLPGGEGFAGSTLTPDAGVHRVASYLGLPLADARRLWSEAPAKAFGVKLPKSFNHGEVTSPIYSH